MPSPFGKRKVRQHERGLGIAERGHRLGLVSSLDHMVALRLERELEHRAQRVLVFDEKDRGAQRNQPAGTPARRASSSMAAIALV
jgi:hypothetical protein